MRKTFLILCLFIIFSIGGYSQTDKIKDSDFFHYTDCQQYDNWKTKKGDTLKIRKSFLFNSNGNVLRKLEEVFEKEPRSKDLTVYQYDNKLLLFQTLYQRTDMKNVFDTTQIIYFYNKIGLIDSQVVIKSFPNFEYKPIDGIIDSTINMQNVRVFKEQIWLPISEYVDTLTICSPLSQHIMFSDGKEMRFAGYKKSTKEVILIGVLKDTLTNCKYFYNGKGQRINEYFDSGYWNILSRTIIDYDVNGHLSSVLCYSKNTYKNEYHAKMDSTNFWLKVFDKMSKEEATREVARKVKESMSDTLLKFNSYIAYNKDGSVTETAVYSDEIYKLTCYRNKSGQMVKTIHSHAYVHNKYENSRYIPTDIKSLSISDYSLYESTSIYQYDTLGRITKVTHKSIDNDSGEAKRFRKSGNFIIYKYKDDRPLKLPESEYVDGYSSNHHYYSIGQ